MDCSSWAEFPVNNIYWSIPSYMPCILSACPRRVCETMRMCSHKVRAYKGTRGVGGGLNCYCGFRTCLRIETIGEKWSEMKTRWTIQQRQRKRRVMLKSSKEKSSDSNIDIHTLRNRYSDGLDEDRSMFRILVRWQMRSVVETTGGFLVWGFMLIKAHPIIMYRLSTVHSVLLAVI